MPIIKNCMHCDKQFSTYVSNIKRGGGKFCSHQCFRNHPQQKRNKYGGKNSAERFLNSIYKNKDHCWEWIGHRNKGGYGRIRRNNLDWTSHRYSWFIHFGEIPNNLFVLHKCDNRICVNPDHLFLGTHKDNMKDMSNKKRTRDQNGSKHSCSKLNEFQVLEIRNRLSNGEEGKKLSIEFNVCPMTISNIKLRKKWKHI